MLFVGWTNYIYLRAIILLLCIVNIYYPSSKYIHNQDYFFTYYIKCLGLWHKLISAESGDLWDDNWLVFCFCFPVFPFASIHYPSTHPSIVSSSTPLIALPLSSVCTDRLYFKLILFSLGNTFPILYIYMCVCVCMHLCVCR